MSLLTFFKWLSETAWSVRLHESHYAYPLIESIHVWGMSVFFGLALLFDLRPLGWTTRRRMGRPLDRIFLRAPAESRGDPYIKFRV